MQTSMIDENDYMAPPKKTPTQELYDLCSQNEDDLQKLKDLLNNGANVNEILKNGDTCLCIACNKGYENIVKFLIDNKADVNQCRSANSIMSTNVSSSLISGRRRSRYNSTATTQQMANCIGRGDSPLNLCLKYGFESIALILIDNGAELCDGRSVTSLHNIEFDKSSIHEAIRLNCCKTLDKLLKTIYEKNDLEAIDWLFNKRYDLLRHVFINENIEVIRIVIPYVLKRNHIEGEFLAHILNYLLMKNKIQDKKQKAYEILQTIMEICALENETDEAGVVIHDLDYLVKGFFATLRAQYNTFGSDDNRSDLLHFRTSLFLFVLKYQSSLRNFDEFLPEIDYTFNSFYVKMKDTGENIIKLIEFFITFYDILITMNHLNLSIRNVKNLLCLEHVKRIDILGDFLIQRSLTPLDLKELCRIKIKDSLVIYNLYSINKLPFLDAKLKDFLYFL